MGPRLSSHEDEEEEEEEARSEGRMMPCSYPAPTLLLDALLLLLPRSPQRFGAEARRSFPLSRGRGRDALSAPRRGAEASRQPADAGVIQPKFSAARGTPGVSCFGIVCCSLRASGLRRFRCSGARKTGFPFPDKQSSGPAFHLHLIEHPQVHTPCKNTTRRYFRSWNERVQLKKLMAYRRSEYVEERDRATSNHSLPRQRSSRSPGENEAELRRFGSIRKSRIQPDFTGGSCGRSQPSPCHPPRSLGFVSPPLGAPPPACSSPSTEGGCRRQKASRLGLRTRSRPGGATCTSPSLQEPKRCPKPRPRHLGAPQQHGHHWWSLQLLVLSSPTSPSLAQPGRDALRCSIPRLGTAESFLFPSFPALPRGISEPPPSERCGVGQGAPRLSWQPSPGLPAGLFVLAAATGIRGKMDSATNLC